MIRKAMKDVQLDNGSIIPSGTLVHAVSHAMHNSESHYPGAREFDALRFWRMRKSSGNAGAKFQFSSTASDYIPFGYGQTAWFVPYPIHPSLKLHLLSHIVFTALDGFLWPDR